MGYRELCEFQRDRYGGPGCDAEVRLRAEVCDRLAATQPRAINDGHVRSFFRCAEPQSAKDAAFAARTAMRGAAVFVADDAPVIGVHLAI